MQVHGLYLLIAAILIIPQNILGKYLFKRNSVARSDDDWDQSAESFGRPASVKRQQPFDDERKLHANSGFDGLNGKRASEFDDSREEPEVFADKRNLKRSPFGVVYSDGQPIGVLEPIYQSYQFRNLDEPVHNYNKRDLDEQLDNVVSIESDEKQNKANLRGGKYAAVLASFKIDNRLKTDASKSDDAVSIEKRREKNRISKRGPAEEDMPAKDLSKPANFIDAARIKTKREALDLGQIEQNIMHVMSDLGLVGDEKLIVQKREVDKVEKREPSEDEDLEMGPNKITMTKEHPERSKKDGFCPRIENVSNFNEDSKQEDTKFKRTVDPNIKNYQNEGESYIRSKRQNSDVGAIVKDLETSGDLTVSGNKSPLVSVNSEQNNSDNKRGINALTSENENDVRKRNDENEYEKRLERNIQEKISAIKADVKREISNLQEQDRKKRETNSVYEDAVEQKTGEKISNILNDFKDRSKRNLSEKTDLIINEAEGQETREIRNATIPKLADEGIKALEQARARRQVEDDVIEDQYIDHPDDEEFVEIPRKRETENKDIEMDKEKRTIDVKINNENDNDHNIDNDLNNMEETPKFVKRSEEANNVPVASQGSSSINQPMLTNSNIQPGVQFASQPASVNVQQLQQQPVQGQVAPPQPQPPPLTGGIVANNNMQQQPIQLNGLAPGVALAPAVALAPQAQPIAPQMMGANNQPNQVGLHPNMQVAPQLQTNGVQQQQPANINNGQAQQQQPVVVQAGIAQNTLTAGQRPVAVGPVNKSMRRENLANEYEEDEFEPDKFEEIRSIDPGLETDGNVRIDKEVEDGEEEDSESEPEHKLVRHSRFLHNITDEEMRNLENENPSFEQRKRRQADNYQYDEYDDNAMVNPKRSKRAYYYGRDIDVDNEDLDEFDEPENQGMTRKRNAVDLNQEYDDVDNQNNYYSKNKRQTRYNNYPTYLDNSDTDQFDVVPNYYRSEDYRRRKRQALDSVSAFHGGGPMLKHHKKVQSNGKLFRKKRLESKGARKSAKEISMEALSNSELFGGLPQTFQGELSRFKRVKRTST